MTDVQGADIEGWREYWLADRRASCQAHNAATDDEIAMRWLQWFAGLPDRSRILDIATGNGIVLGHAARAARAAGKTFELTGVDLADIDPLRHVTGLAAELPGARFLANVAAEATPFKSCSFDVVTSQYGMEYANLEAALQEAARVLVSGGSLRWLAHCANSDVVAQHDGQIAEVDFLLAAGGPVDAMRAFVASAQRQADMRTAMQALLGSFASAERFCLDRPPARVVRQVCGEFAEIAGRWRAYDPAELATMLADGMRELRAHRRRMDDLQRATLTSQRLEVIRSALRHDPWIDGTIAELRVGQGPSLIGVLIGARRAG